MDKAISATEANRQFSRLLDEVRQGRSYVVTSHGEPVARISPVDQSGTAIAHARKSLLANLRKQRIVDVGRWTRDELYEREQ